MNNVHLTRSISLTIAFIYPPRFWTYVTYERTNVYVTCWQTSTRFGTTSFTFSTGCPAASYLAQSRSSWWTIHLALESIARGSYRQLWKRGILHPLFPMVRANICQHGSSFNLFLNCDSCRCFVVCACACIELQEFSVLVVVKKLVGNCTVTNSETRNFHPVIVSWVEKQRR